MHDSYSGLHLWLHYKLIFILGFQSIQTSILSKGTLLATLEHIHEGLAMIIMVLTHRQWHFHHPCFVCLAPCIFPGDFPQPLMAPHRPHAAAYAQLAGWRCYGAPPLPLNKGAKQCIAADTQPWKALSVLTELSLTARWEIRHKSRVQENNIVH